MKDLAKEYALARLQGRLSGNEVSFSENKIFTEEDIETAFNAGRESVVENMPELEWNDFSDDLTEYFASCPVGWCYKISYKINEFELFCNDCFIGRFFSIEYAKQAANEDYKKRIKQVLGL